MKLIIRYWGVLTELAGCTEEELDLNSGFTVTSLNNRLITNYPAFNGIPLIFFTRGKIINGNYTIPEGMEIDCMPPFSGG